MVQVELWGIPLGNSDRGPVSLLDIVDLDDLGEGAQNLGEVHARLQSLSAARCLPLCKSSNDRPVDIHRKVGRRGADFAANSDWPGSQNKPGFRWLGDVDWGRVRRT